MRNAFLQLSQQLRAGTLSKLKNPKEKKSENDHRLSSQSEWSSQDLHILVATPDLHVLAAKETRGVLKVFLTNAIRDAVVYADYGIDLSPFFSRNLSFVAL